MNMMHAVHSPELSMLSHHKPTSLSWEQCKLGLEWLGQAITSHVIKQDGSSPSSKPHMANEGSEHKYSCVAKINKINAFKIKVAIAS